MKPYLILFFVISLSVTTQAHAEVVGGVINTVTQEISLHHKNTANSLTMGATPQTFVFGQPVSKTKGSLYVVDFKGGVKISTTTYKDARGVSIALPASNMDKVVHVDSTKKIIAGFGLSVTEMKALAHAIKMPEAVHYASFLQKPERDSIMRAVLNASNKLLQKNLWHVNRVLDEMVEDIDLEAGVTAGDMVDAILLAAEVNPTVPNINLLKKTDDLWAEPVVTGVDVICDGGGDNGGPGDGYINGGGDNGGPGDGYVGGGDNGGPGDGYTGGGDNGGPGDGYCTGHTGGGDNGGPGDGYVLEGWKGTRTPTLPSVKGVNARVEGIYMMIH